MSSGTEEEDMDKELLEDDSSAMVETFEGGSQRLWQSK